jgi:uncharacterized protein YxjI
MKRYNLFGEAFIIEDDKGNITYYIKEQASDNQTEENEFIIKNNCQDQLIKRL